LKLELSFSGSYRAQKGDYEKYLFGHGKVLTSTRLQSYAIGCRGFDF
jgi:hypothetical protein